MNEILTAVIPVVIIGLICAVVLVAASKFMGIKENEKIPQIRECLPGANCGACGFAGCDGYAKALAEDSKTATNLCVPGGDSVSRQLSEILGVEFEDVIEQVAFVRCSGDCTATEDRVEYIGISNCAAAKQIFGSKGQCSFGCLGLGDCAKVCPNDAVCIEDGIARIKANNCVGCGLCVKACPNNVIVLTPDVQRAVTACSSKDKGGVTRKSCKNGCIGCKKCEKVCPLGAVKIVDNLAFIDSSKCSECPDFGVCARECTTGCIALAYPKTANN